MTDFVWEEKSRAQRKPFEVEPVEPSQARAIKKLDLWIDNHLWVWLFWDFPGLRWVCEHLVPPTELEKKRRRPASSFCLLFLGPYVTIFGIALAEHSRRTNRIEGRFTAVIEQMRNERSRPIAFSQIAEVQNLVLPVKPELFSPAATLNFFTGQLIRYEVGWERLRNEVEAQKGALSQANLDRANLSGAELSKADLEGARLIAANLNGTFLHNANLSEAILLYANLQGADLSKANLRGTDLSEVNLSGADLTNADLSGANLYKVRGWYNVTSWSGANIYAIKKPPEGFKNFVLSHYGIEKPAIQTK